MWLTCIADLTRSFGILAVSVLCFSCSEPFAFSILLASNSIFVISAEETETWDVVPGDWPDREHWACPSLAPPCAATVALDTGKARLCTLSAVTSAARTLPQGSAACKLTGYLPFSPPPLILPYRLPKSCPLTRCFFKNNQMNKMQRPWGMTLRDPISWRLVTWLNFPKQQAKLRKLNWFLFACFTTLCSVIPLLFCDIIIHHSWIALCQHYSSTHHV